MDGSLSLSLYIYIYIYIYIYKQIMLLAINSRTLSPFIPIIFQVASGVRTELILVSLCLSVHTAASKSGRQLENITFKLFLASSAMLFCLFVVFEMRFCNSFVRCKSQDFSKNHITFHIKLLLCMFSYHVCYASIQLNGNGNNLRKKKIIFKILITSLKQFTVSVDVCWYQFNWMRRCWRGM